MVFKLLKKLLRKPPPSDPRDEFPMLVVADPDSLRHATIQAMEPGDKRKELLRLCGQLAADKSLMPADLCAALNMLPGTNFAAGAAPARLSTHAKDAG